MLADVSMPMMMSTIARVAFTALAAHVVPGTVLPPSPFKSGPTPPASVTNPGPSSGAFVPPLSSNPLDGLSEPHAENSDDARRKEATDSVRKLRNSSILDQQYADKY